MNIYEFLVNGYWQVLGIFPPAVQWVVSLALLIGITVAFINLVRENALFLIVLVIILPVLIPILGRVFTDLWSFFLFLLQQVGLQAPKA